MRIIAKAKPIRIRIKSGGEEHFSLDSLCRNLCVQELWPLIKDHRLSRWLMQLGEVDLAHEIDALSECQLDFLTYFKVLVIFLKDDLVGRNVTELYSLFSFWHDCEKRKSKNYDSLRKYLLSKYEGTKFIFKQYPKELSDGEWWDVFSKFEKEEDPEFLFKQGKLAFEGFTKCDRSNFDKDLVRGKKLIEKAAELHNQEVIDFVKSNKFDVARKLAMLTPEAKEKIDNLIVRWKDEMLDFSIRKTNFDEGIVRFDEGIVRFDEGIVREVKQLLQEFASLRKTYRMFTMEAVKTEAETKYRVLDELDEFYKERKFVLDLARYSYDKGIPGLFVKLAEDSHYPLAQYMLHRPADNRIEGFAFAATMFPNQLRFIVDHLFKY